MNWIIGLALAGGLSLYATPPKSALDLTIENCQKPLLVELSKAESLTDFVSQEIEKSRLNFYLGRCAFIEKESSISIPFFEQGEKNAENALELKNDEPVALFWWAANKGVLADIYRSLSALKTVKLIETKMLLIRDKNPDYGFLGADRILGKLYQKAPRFISIGSSSKAEECLKRAYEKFPKFPGNIIALAEFYDDDGRLEEAKKVLLPLVDSQQIQKGDYGPFNVEKQEWDKIVTALIEKWRPKGE